MTDPSKPASPSLLSRLPAMPSRPGSKSRMQAVGREEAARKRLTTRIEAIPVTNLEPASVDPRTAAVAALMVANFVGQEQVRKRFSPLVAVKLFDAALLEDLPVAARFVLRILPKLGPELHECTTTPPADVLAEATAKHAELLRLAERYLSDIDEASGRLVTVRLGEGAADLVNDLRTLADIVRDYRETLESEAGTLYRPDSEREARELATQLEMSIIGPLGEEDREWRSYLLRALAMLVPIYEEVCRAGRFLFAKEKPEARFPSLAAVARVRRRLAREVTRRNETAPQMRVAVASARSSRPPSQSIPPEISLVDVSEADEEALAGALESQPPPVARHPPVQTHPAIHFPAVHAHPPPAMPSPSLSSSAPPPSSQGVDPFPSPPPRRPAPPAPPAAMAMPSSAPALRVTHSSTPAPLFHRASPSTAATAPPPVASSAPSASSLRAAPESTIPPALFPVGSPGTSEPAPILDVVTLDFSSELSPGEDADANLDTAELDIEVTYASESNFYSDVTGTDIGLFIATYVVKPTGTPLSVRLTLPQIDYPIVVAGNVHWVREFSPSIEAPPGMGIALTRLPHQHRNEIEAFMKLRAPILHDM